MVLTSPLSDTSLFCMQQLQKIRCSYWYIFADIPKAIQVLLDRVTSSSSSSLIISKIFYSMKKHELEKTFTFMWLLLVLHGMVSNSLLLFPPDSPSPTAARTLTLVAKSVQNLANLVEFGAKVNILLQTDNSLELCLQYISMFLLIQAKICCCFLVQSLKPPGLSSSSRRPH